MQITAWHKDTLFFFFFPDPPGPIDNSKITVNKNGHLTLKQGITTHFFSSGSILFYLVPVFYPVIICKIN